MTKGNILETLEVIPGIKPKAIGKLGSVFFIYNIPKKENLVSVDRWCQRVNYANANVLDNIVKFIPFNEGNGLNVEREGNFGGSTYFTVFMNSEQFKEWYNLNMEESRFRKGEKCDHCNQEINELENLALSGGVAYHRKKCFGEQLHKKWTNYDQNYESMRYFMKVVNEFDKENPSLKHLETKFSLLDIKERIGSAYENYLVPFVVHSDEGMSEDEAWSAIRDEISDAKKDFNYITSESFYDFEKYGMTEEKARELLHRGKFEDKIYKIFEKGEEFSGINIHEVQEYKDIRDQCETLFNCYNKYWSNKE